MSPILRAALRHAERARGLGWLTEGHNVRERQGYLSVPFTVEIQVLRMVMTDSKRNQWVKLVCVLYGVGFGYT